MLLLQVLTRPYAAESSNTIELLILSVHASITAIMRTASFPLGANEASAMAALIFIPGSLLLCEMIHSHLSPHVKRFTRHGHAAADLPSATAGLLNDDESDNNDDIDN